MKSVLFFIPTLGGGGAERVLANLVNNLDKGKYRITVKTLFDVGVNRKLLSPHIQYGYCFRHMFRGNTKILALFSPGFLYKHLIGERFDIAISYLESPCTRIISGCPYPDTKLVNWVHVEQHTIGAAACSYRSAREARRCMDRYDRTICVADTVRRDLMGIFNLSGPCEVLYNTNDSENILKLSAEPLSEDIFSQEVNVISVGRLIPMKGYDRLVSVHKRLLEKGLKHNVYILGTGEEEQKLRNLVKENGVDDSFHFLGYDENPYKYVAKADVFVCSSRREGFSTAVTEALILGVPIVSTSVSGAKELLGENNEYGLVVENSEEGIFSGLEKLISDKALLEYYKDKAIIRGREFSKENTVLAVERMLDSI